jgi:integrase
MATRYGEGSVYFDNERGLWVGQIELEPGPDGKPRRKRVTAKKKTTMLAKLNDAKQQKGRGLLTADKNGSTRAWLEHWSNQIIGGSDLSPNTISQYQWITSKYLIPAVGRFPLGKLTPEHVEQMMGAQRDAGLSSRTIAYGRAVLRISLGEAERRGLIARNVAALTRAPRKTATKLDDALDADQAAAVLDAARGDRLEALAVLVLAVGLRQGEALALRWNDIDLKGARLTIDDAKTSAGIRTVALPDFVVAALRDHRQRQRAERIAADVWADPGLVFASTVGTRLDARNVLRWWHALTTRAGVGRRRFHASRHTAATLMLNNGVPLEVVSVTLGHAGLAITADVYAKVRPDLQRTAADAMQNVLGTSRR